MISLFPISRSGLSLILLDTTDDLLLENYEVKIGMADAWPPKMKIKVYRLAFIRSDRISNANVFIVSKQCIGFCLSYFGTLDFRLVLFPIKLNCLICRLWE